MMAKLKITISMVTAFTDSEGNSNIGEFKDDKSHGYGIYIAIK